MITSPQSSNPKAPCNVVMEISPKQASRWLDGNTHNRPIQQAVVDRFARDMVAGRWQLTHQGIAFDPDGVLIDGQHRLWAIVLASKPVRMRVFFNEPLDNMRSVDTGKSRSNFDVLHLSGEAGEITTNHLATLRAMIGGDGTHAPRLSVSEEADLMAKHTAAVNFAIEHLGSCRVKGVVTATIRGIVARAFYSADHAKLTHFCDVLKTGCSTDEDDGPIILLWQFLVNNARAGKAQAVRRVRYGKTERA